MCQYPHATIFDFLMGVDEKSPLCLCYCLLELSETVKDQSDEQLKDSLKSLRAYDPDVSQNHLELFALFIEFCREIVASLTVVDQKLHELDLLKPTTSTQT